MTTGPHHKKRPGAWCEEAQMMEAASFEMFFLRFTHGGTGEGYDFLWASHPRGQMKEPLRC